MAWRQVQKLSRRGEPELGVARHAALKGVAVRIGHARYHDAADLFGGLGGRTQDRVPRRDVDPANGAVLADRDPRIAHPALREERRFQLK